MARFLFRTSLLVVLCVLLFASFSPTIAQGPDTDRRVHKELEMLAQQRINLPPGLRSTAGVAGVGSGGSRVQMRVMDSTTAATDQAELPADHQISQASYAAAKQATRQVKTASALTLNNDPAGSHDLTMAPRAPIYFGASYKARSFTGAYLSNPDVVPTQTDVVALVKNSFTVYTKSNPPQVIGRFDIPAWFAQTFHDIEAGTIFYDTRVIYHYDPDPGLERVYLVGLAYNLTTSPKKSWIYVSASLQNNAGYAWYSYRLDGSKDGDTATTNYPRSLNIGVDDKNLYITTNQYGYDGTGFKYARIRMLRLTDLQTGMDAPPYYDFVNIQHLDTTMAFTVVPASHYYTAYPMHLVSSENNLSPTGGNIITLFRIDLPASNDWPANPPTLVLVNSMTTTNAFSYPPDAVQLGTPYRLDTSDDRILSARRWVGEIWATLSTARPDGRAGINTYNISTGGTINWESAGWGSDGCDYYYPAVAVDEVDDIGLVFSRSCDDSYAGVRYTGMKVGDTALEPSKVVKAGEAPFVLLDSVNVNRWGEHSGIERDPFDAYTFFIHGSYATTPVGTGTASGRWATWMYTAWYPPYQALLPLVRK